MISLAESDSERRLEPEGGRGYHALMAQPTTALIVDDEPHVRAFVRLLLRELGITTCWEAADGAAALEMEKQHRPELVLLDVNLPVMGGIEVLAALRQRKSDVPVIMVTSQNTLSVANEAARLGAIGYILKHGSKDETLTELREALENLEDADTDESA